MGWQQEFTDFAEEFKQLDAALHRGELSPAEQEELARHLNRTVEKGWRTLQLFLHQGAHDTGTSHQSGETLDKISRDGFFTSYEALRQSFENDESIEVQHDRQYVQNNEWEVREVVVPAFRDLYEFLQSQLS